MEQLYYAVDVGNVEVRKLHAAYAMVNKDYTEERMKSAFVELLTGVHNKLMRHHTERSPARRNTRIGLRRYSASAQPMICAAIRPNSWRS